MTPLQAYKREMRAIMQAHKALQRRAVAASRAFQKAQAKRPDPAAAGSP